MDWKDAALKVFGAIHPDYHPTPEDTMMAIIALRQNASQKDKLVEKLQAENKQLRKDVNEWQNVAEGRWPNPKINKMRTEIDTLRARVKELEEA